MLPHIKLPENYKNLKNVFYVIPILLDIKKIGYKRNRNKAELEKLGVQGLTEGYVNLHMQPMFLKKTCYGSKGFPWNPYNNSIKYYKNQCPIAEKYHNELMLQFQGISLYQISKKNVDDIIKAFKKVWKNLNIN